MKVEFLTHEDLGQLQLFTGNVNGYGFNLSWANGSYNVEICDCLGKIQRHRDFTKEKEAVIEAYKNQ